MRAALTGLVLASACREAPAPEAQVDEAGDDVAIADPIEPPLPAGSEEARTYFRALRAGVVSRELVGACRENPERAAAIALASECAGDATRCGADVSIPLGAVGIDEDGVMAIVSAPWVEPCGGDPIYKVYEASPPWLRPDTTTTFGPGAEGSDTAAAKALAWIGKRLARRYAPVDDMVRFACTLEAWTTPLERLVVLRAPLDGWMVTVARGRRGLPVRLVAPDNRRVWDLGAIELGPERCDTEEGARDGPCEREVSAAILQIVPSASRRTLVVTARLGPGDRCAISRVVHVSFRIPDGVRGELVKPSEHGIQRRPVEGNRPPVRRGE